MQFRSDREFIGKILDAQIRVNQVESRILKKPNKSFDFASLLRNGPPVTKKAE